MQDKIRDGRVCGSGTEEREAIDRRRLLSVVGAASLGMGLAALPRSARASEGVAHQCAETIEDLRDVRKLDGCYMVLGHSAPGDGGGGVFWFDPDETAADDDGVIIAPRRHPGRGRWRRLVPGDAVNVRWYGATGDGETDDGVRIRAVIGAASGRTLVFPAGIYRIATSLTIPNDAAFEMGAVLLADAGATVRLEGTVDAHPQKVVFAGDGTFRLDTVGTVHPHWWAANGPHPSPNTDFAARWNAMWDACPYTRRIVATGEMTLAGPLDLTSSRDFWREVDFTFSPITAAFSGKAVFDTTNSRWLHVKNINALALHDEPTAGILCARTSENAAGNCIFENVNIRGRFTVATLFNASAELQTFLKCLFTNSRGPAAFLNSGPVAGDVPVASDFLPIYGGIISASGLTFIDCRFAADNGYVYTAENPVSHPTDAGQYGSTIIIRGSSNVHFKGVTYVRSNGCSAIHLNVMWQHMHDISIDALWNEYWNAEPNIGNSEYSLTAYGGNGDVPEASAHLSDLQFHCTYNNVARACANIKVVKCVRGLVYRGAGTPSGKYDLVWEVGNPFYAGLILGMDVDLSMCWDANTRLDLSAINKATKAEVSGIVKVARNENYIPPTNALRNKVTIFSNTEGVTLPA